MLRILRQTTTVTTRRKLAMAYSSSEVSAAHAAAASAPPADTIFGKILRKELPSTPVYEDERVYAFRDIQPQAPVHVVVIPKRNIPQLSKATDSDTELLGYLLSTARKIADQEQLHEGYRIIINDGKQYDLCNYNYDEINN